MRTVGYITVFDLVILLILSNLRFLYLFAVVLVYEAIFITIVGVFQILGTYIYREDKYRLGSKGYPSAVADTGWFNFKKFAKLKPEDRQRYRQEGTAMIIIGLAIGVALIIVSISQAS